MEDPEKNENSSDSLDPSEESREILMSYGFTTILCTMNFGLLTVFIQGNKISYCPFSFNQFVFVVTTISMITLSVILGPAVVHMELQKDGSSTGLSIILIVRMFHICGFVFLMIRGQWVSAQIPLIWNMCSELVQNSIVNVFGKNCKSLKDLCSYCKCTLIKYTILVVMNEIYYFMTAPNSLINHGFVEFYNVPISTFDNRLISFVAVTGYIAWEFCNISHVLVSLFLGFFISIIMISIKSINKQIEEMVKELNEKHTGENQNFFLVRKANFVNNLFESKPSSDWETAIKLEKFKSTVNLCEKIVCTLSSVFGISVIIEGMIMVANMLVHLFRILYAFQRCADENGSLDRSEIILTNPMDVIGFIIQGFTHFYFFFRLACLSEEMTAQARRPLKILKQLLYSRISTALQTKIEIFKGDVDKSVIELTAAGYLVLNRKLITAVVSSVTTYLIVLLQLKHQEGGSQSLTTNSTAYKCYSVL